jgi:hypothetical protein
LLKDAYDVSFDRGISSKNVLAEEATAYPLLTSLRGAGHIVVSFGFGKPIIAEFAGSDVDYIPCIKNCDADFNDEISEPSMLPFRVDGHNQSVFGKSYGVMCVLG